MSLPAIRPVILGADIGIYALARAFHEEYSVTSTVVASAALGPIAHSAICDVHLVAHNYNPDVIVAELIKIGQRKKPNEVLILLANSDWFVRVIVQNRAALEPYYVVPFLGEQILDDISDKATFALICNELGISVPTTYVQDFSNAHTNQWQPVQVDLEYPVIAKAASSADYQDIEFEGKMKVFEIATPQELDNLWASLRNAGFTGRFVVQELIPGDDTQMRSITAYVDRSGAITLLGGAHVLLEEHTPNGLGNPAAMITMRDDDMFAQAAAFLQHTGYHGFANFDVKIDPRDGHFKFFEVNPRIGRNNYYMTAAGGNPARALVEDYVYGRSTGQRLVDQTILYSVVPVSMLDHYVREPNLNAQLSHLIQAQRYVNPLDNPIETSLKRRMYVKLALVNQRRKFKEHYPHPTGTGF
ncbi:hypothetical protein [Timonella sp. A28]|uniref:carboxylate--amine ligase n=1 Tax=Timonella sp. A28 TaxID=3442640 RepID=UPI003EB92BA3